MAGNMSSSMAAIQSPGPQTPMLHRSYLVEFIGLPGSGKSTIAQRTAEHLQRRGEVVNLMMVSGRTSRLARARKQQIALSYLALRHPVKLLSSAASFNALPLSSPGSRIRLHLNWCLHLARWYRLRGTAGIHLLDQGLFQVLWSLGFEHGPAAVERFHAGSRQDYPAPDVVVMVIASPKRLRTRLQARGGRNAFSRTSAASHDIDGVYERGLAALHSVGWMLSSQNRSRLVTVDNDEDDALEERSEALAVELQRQLYASHGSANGTGSQVVDV